jgi:hypothetical protein
MSKKEEAVEDKALEFDVMPGADKVEDDDAPQLDLNFETPEEEPEEVAEEEEVVAEDETEEPVAEEPEETVAEDEGSEPEAKAEEPVAEEKPAKKPMVPKARLDEVLNKQKALQKQIDDMKAAQQPAPDAPEEFDFAAKEVDYQNHLLDGDAEKAAAVRAEIRQAERVQIEYEMTQKMTDTVSNNHQANALQQAAAALEADFPVFDQKSPSYDEALTTEVIELRDAFMVQGANPVAALSRAAKFVISENNLVDNSEPGSTLGSTDEVSKKRAEVNKKLKAADAQPPEMGGEGAATRGEKALDLSSMTEEEFDALPEATLKRLRGDIL